MTFALLASVCFAHAALGAYERQDTVALRRMTAAAETREDSLVVHYRLYALTRDRSLLARLPNDLPGGTGRELALLSALWAFRLEGAKVWQMPSWGRRTAGLLDRALAAAPDDPLVQLIDAQSLLFRPGFAGGSTSRGIERLTALRDRLAGQDACGVDRLEAEVWLWYALRKAGSPRAAALFSELSSRDLPPLYREFLAGPP